MATLLLPAATPYDLVDIASFVEECCQPAAPDARAMYQITLAVDETCTNVLEHAYGGEAGPLRIEVEAEPGLVTIRVRDWGAPFDPTAAPPLDPSLPLHQRPTGGMGIHIIRQVMDEVAHTPREDGNCLLLRKRLPR